VADALATADLTTGPQGQPMTFPERLEEILARYPARGRREIVRGDQCAALAISYI
jgi:hypothetical protein